jgi:hypothetical protein
MSRVHKSTLARVSGYVRMEMNRHRNGKEDRDARVLCSAHRAQVMYRMNCYRASFRYSRRNEALIQTETIPSRSVPAPHARLRDPTALRVWKKRGKNVICFKVILPPPS